MSRQALLCHRTLRTLECVTKESTTITRVTWEAVLKFLLAVTDTLLAPPKELGMKFSSTTFLVTL